MIEVPRDFDHGPERIEDGIYAYYATPTRRVMLIEAYSGSATLHYQRPAKRRKSLEWVKDKTMPTEMYDTHAGAHEAAWRWASSCPVLFGRLETGEGNLIATTVFGVDEHGEPHDASVDAAHGAAPTEGATDT